MNRDAAKCNLWNHVRLLFLSAACCLSVGQSFGVTTNAILFVTQVPMPTEINSRTITQSTVNVSSPFGNHLGDTAACGRGGALMIRYSDGTITNLTALAGYGVASGFQGSNSIAVREPSVDWSGTKALFSMVVGAPASTNDTTQFVWQIYEITSFAVKGQLPTITKVPNQPSAYNNVSPTYGTDGRIIFSSDRPRDGSLHLYPQREEYLQVPTVTGLWSLDPNTGDLFLMEHSPSGSFTPFVDSFGRVIFTRWDHLSRDVQRVTDSQGTSTNNVFNYSDESAGALVTTNTTEMFPEPRPSDHAALAGTALRGNAFNFFLPWQINEDGTTEEIVNHVGRQELFFQIQNAVTNDPNIVTLNAPQRFNTNYLSNIFHLHEDPNTPGLLYGIDAIDIGTHTAGQILTLTASTNINPDSMVINYITPKATAFPNPNGLYRNPLPLSNGVLVAVYAPGATTNDFNMGTPTTPLSKYDFRLRTMKTSGGTFVADIFLTTGFTNNVNYFVGNSLVTYNGPMWELDPVEVAARPMPQAQSAAVADIEASVFASEGVDIPTFQNYLRTNNLALVVSRNITARDHNDQQQPYNLKVAWSSTQTLGSPTGTIYSVGFLQLMQADQLRGFKPDGVNPAQGRRVIAQPMHDTVAENLPNTNGPAGSVQIGDDGSFAVVVPARRAMSWQLTDTNAAPVVRERYWVSFQPGEVRTCANCHGINTTDQAGNGRPTNAPQALHQLLQWWKANNPQPGPQGSLQFSASSYSVNEGGTNAVITVTRLNGTNGVVGVTYSTGDSSATNGSDYSAATSTLSWADGDGASKTFVVAINDDGTAEGDETLNVTLSNPTGGATLGSLTNVTLTIVDNDTGLNHNSGAVGNVITILGSGFAGTTNVQFNGVDAQFVVDSDSQISAVVPFGATSGSITISTPGGTAVIPNFIVTASTELPAVYVADTSNNRIQKSTNGVDWVNVGLGLGTGPGQFRNPEAVAASEDGQTIYVADTKNNRVQKSTDGGGTWSNLVGATVVKAPQGVTLAINGDVYVADTKGNRVLRFAAGDPTLMTVLLGTTQVKIPIGLAVDANNTLYVADTKNNRILRIDAADSTNGVAVVTTGVKAPQGVAVDNDGNLYVADTGNSRVLFFALGTGSPTVLTSTGQVKKPEGMTVCWFATGTFGGDSYLLISDTGNSRILGKFNPDLTGSFTLHGGKGAASGQFNKPGKIR